MEDGVGDVVESSDYELIGLGVWLLTDEETVV
jgi:hypothetical protein